MKSHAREVKEGNRFEFGKNWSLFLSGIDEDRIRVAVESLQQYLGVNDLRGKTFLDVGCGSGLFSLAARRLGARVHSFDYDPESVACGLELRRRFDNDSPDWTVEEGSALDPEYLKSLGAFDVVYSWGVLHHTGAMWQALENVISLVAPGGKLFIAIYNDQGTISRRWTAVKKVYNRTPALRFPISFLTAVHFLWRPMLKDILKAAPGPSSPAIVIGAACRTGATLSTGWEATPLKWLSPSKSSTSIGTTAFGFVISKPAAEPWAVTNSSSKPRP